MTYTEYTQKCTRVFKSYERPLEELREEIRVRENKVMNLKSNRYLELKRIAEESAMWKVGQLFDEDGKFWKIDEVIAPDNVTLVADIRYKIVGVGISGKELHGVDNIITEKILKKTMKPIDKINRKAGLPATIKVAKVQLLGEAEKNYMKKYLVTGADGKLYVVEYSSHFGDTKHIYEIRRQNSSYHRSYRNGLYAVYSKWISDQRFTRKFRNDGNIHEIKCVAKDNKELIEDILVDLI